MAEKKSRTTIRLPEDVYRKLVKLKEETGATIQHQVLAAVRQYLKKRGA